MNSLRVKQGGSEGTSSKLPVGYGSGRHAAPASGVSAADSFDAALESSEVERLLDRLYDVSDRLSVFPSGQLLAEYRSVLTELLRRAMQGLRIKRDMRWRKTDKKMYVTIERTEEAMDELEEAFLYEGDRTKALALMEEIKGCLISLLM